MEMNEYQDRAMATAFYPGEYRVFYPALKLNGEAGEIAELVGKAIRDDNGVISDGRRAAIIKELGDVLWYIAALAVDLGASLEAVAQGNIDKLASRAQRGVLRGSGDER